MSYKLERTFDYDLVREMLTCPNIYPHISSDYHPPVESFRPNSDPSIHYLLVIHKGLYCGLCIAHPIHTPDTWEVHHAIRRLYVRHTDNIGKAFEHWLFSETPCKTAVGFTPMCNTLAVRYALRMGMKKVGVIPQGYLKGGQLFDIMITAKVKP